MPVGPFPPKVEPIVGGKGQPHIWTKLLLCITQLQYITNPSEMAAVCCICMAVQNKDQDSQREMPLASTFVTKA